MWITTSVQPLAILRRLALFLQPHFNELKNKLIMAKRRAIDFFNHRR